MKIYVAAVEELRKEGSKQDETQFSTKNISEFHQKIYVAAVEVLRKKEREGENRNETQCFSCYVFLTSQKTLIDQMEWGTHQFNNDIVAFSTYACAVSDDQAHK